MDGSPLSRRWIERDRRGDQQCGARDPEQQAARHRLRAHHEREPEEGKSNCEDRYADQGGGRQSRLGETADRLLRRIVARRDQASR